MARILYELMILNYSCYKCWHHCEMSLL